MDRINAVASNPEYKRLQRQIDEFERDREYCKHDLAHSLDVARIAYIYDLENNCGIARDIIYVTALLHDLGRSKQYEEGVAHEVACVEIANMILGEEGFDMATIDMITAAISQHRKDSDHSGVLGEILYHADKLSRNCYCCKASGACKWSDEKKNKIIKY